MDAAARVRELAVHVGEIHLEAKRYLADGQRRDPLQLPQELARIKLLIADLQQYAFPLVPNQLFAHHMRNTREIEDELLAVERSFAGGNRPIINAPEDAPAGVKRRRNEIPRDELMNLVNLDYQIKEIAEIYSFCPKTVSRRLHDLGHYKRPLLKSTTDEELEVHIRRWWETADEERTGADMAWGWLKSEGIQTTRDQVRDVIRRLQPDAVLARGLRTVERREYHVAFPNSLWHMDGHHKLIRWKMLIHGAIDGYSHLVTYMGATNNNRAETVRRLFLQSTETYGWPQRVRADYGGENVQVGEDMEFYRGENRGSFITGSSTKNQRIERLWVDLGKDLGRKFAATFKALENSGKLEIDDPLHLYCLHFVFLPLLQKFCDTFVKTYNNHHPSSEGSGGMSPRKQWHKGLLNAAANGFAFDHFPDRDEEEREWWQAVRENGVLDAERYQPEGRHYQARQRQAQDPYVHVDRFSEYLPDFLYSEAFLRNLHDNFPPPLFKDASDQYVSLLFYVARVPEWHFNGREAQMPQ